MVKKQLYSESYANSLQLEIDLIYKILEEIDDESKKKQYQKLLREKIKFLNYLVY